jgi:hypothetical protein
VTVEGRSAGERAQADAFFADMHQIYGEYLVPEMLYVAKKDPSGTDSFLHGVYRLSDNNNNINNNNNNNAESLAYKQAGGGLVDDARLLVASQEAAPDPTLTSLPLGLGNATGVGGWTLPQRRARGSGANAGVGSEGSQGSEDYVYSSPPGKADPRREVWFDAVASAADGDNTDQSLHTLLGSPCGSGAASWRAPNTATPPQWSVPHTLHDGAKLGLTAAVAFSTGNRLVDFTAGGTMGGLRGTDLNYTCGTDTSQDLRAVPPSVAMVDVSLESISKVFRTINFHTDDKAKKSASGVVYVLDRTTTKVLASSEELPTIPINPTNRATDDGKLKVTPPAALPGPSLGLLARDVPDSMIRFTYTQLKTQRGDVGFLGSAARIESFNTLNDPGDPKRRCVCCE